MADSVAGLGVAAERKRHALSACAHYKRAVCSYQMGERFRTPTDARGLRAYRKAVALFHRFAQLTDQPRIESVEVPFERGRPLPG